MLHTIRTGVALLALVALTTPAAAEENGPDWLSAVGDFVQAGLGPARTMEDIRREEERARQEVLRDAARQERPAVDEAEIEVKVRPDDGDDDGDTAADTAQPATETPAAETSAAVVPPAVAAPVAKAAAGSRPAAAVPAEQARPSAKPERVATAVPLPVPVPQARPVTARVSVPPPAAAPEPLLSRIAATATVDQAIHLGGSEDTYARRLVVPERD